MADQQRTQALRLGASILLLLIAACSTTTQAPPGDSAPTNPPDLSRLPDPVPHPEPLSKYGNKSPYRVLGKTYYVLPSPDNYKEYGNASWYGTKFHGQRTSSGELYDMYQLTAAHRSLPIPSYVRVTNLDNHRSAIVRVNDRGPFHSERLIDLSYAGAVKLGFAERGTARVMIEVVDGTDRIPNDVAQARPNTAVAVNEPAGRSAVPGPEQIFLQAGAFKDAAGAERLRSDLIQIVDVSVHIQRLPNDTFYRVRIGPVAQMSEATRLQAVIVGAAHPKPLIVRE